MNIQVFGVKDSFGINRIGGTDSFYRRLARQWVAQGHTVEFVTYGCNANCQSEGWHGIGVREFARFSDALRYLGCEGHVIIVNAIRKKDRLRFALFRRLHEKRQRFYIVYSLFKEQPVLRHLHFIDSVIAPYNGGAICMSPRLQSALKLWTKKAFLAWPPVAREFFQSPAGRVEGGQIRVAYVGRTEPCKGADVAVKVMENLRGDKRFRLEIIGYHFPEDKAAEVMSHRLRNVGWLRYVHREIEEWSPATDAALAHQLAHTDILLLPYERLSSSIDTPLLLLEGMAASCCVLTRPLGDIPLVYGASPLLISGPDFVGRAVELIRSAPSWLAAERARVYSQVCALGCDEESVARQVLKLIEQS